MGKMLKVIAAGMALAMLFSVLAGCGASDVGKGTTEANSSTSKASDSTSKVENEKPYEFRWMFHFIGNQLPPDNDPIKAKIEKATNTKFTIIVPPSNEYNDKVKITMASGDYPDIIQFLPGTDWREFAQSGAFTPVDNMLKDLINAKKYIEQSQWNLYVSDGKTWGVPLPNVRCYMQLFARQDWIDELGLGSDWEDLVGAENEKSLDEFYKLLKTIKEKKNAVYTSSGGISGMKPFFGAFGVMPTRDFYVKDGENYNRAMQDNRMRDAAAWIHKIYKEGLIDPEIFTNKREQVNNKALQDKASVIYDIWNVRYRLDTQLKIKEVNPNAKWCVINTPRGPGGANLVEYSAAQDGVAVISSKTKSPEKLIKFIDYMFSEEGYRLSCWGIEGTHYNIPNGKLEFTEEGKAAWVNIYGRFKRSSEDEATRAQFGIFGEDLIDSSNESKILDQIAEGFTPGPVWKQYGADLQRFEMDSLIKFILGDVPLANWDEYVKTANEKFHATEINKEIIDGLKKEGRIK